MQFHAFIIALLCVTAASSIFPDDFGSHIRGKRALTVTRASIESPLLPQYATPVGYHVWLQPFPQEGYFQGRVEVNISCLTPTDTLILHAGENLNISKAEISLIEPRDGFGDYSRQIKNVSVVSVLRGSATDWCEVKLSDYLQQGLVYQLTMEFASDLRNGSCGEAMYFDTYSNDCSDNEVNEKSTDKHGDSVERWFVATDMSRNKARKVFPCFDELSYKAPFVISIGRPQRMRSLSNMALRKSEKMLDQPGWVWDKFEATPPISTFSVNLFIFDPDVIVPLEPRRDLGSTTLHMYGPVEMRDALQQAGDKILQTVKKIETYLQMKYPLPDLQIVVTPGVHFNNEGFGLSVFGDNEKSYLWPLSLLNNMGDQWLVHLTTPHSWSDSKFGNSLTYYVSYIGYTAALTDTRSIQSLPWGVIYSAMATSTPHISAIGVTVLRMLNYTLGESTLRSAFDSFLQDRLYDTFVSDDIVAAIDNQSQRRLALPTGVTVSKIISSWMKSQQFPVITVIRNYQTGTAYVEQHAFTQNKSDASSEKGEDLWYVPIVLLKSDQREGNSLQEVSWMKKEQKINLENMPPSNSFIIVDPDIIGFFVVNYDPTNWRLIIQHLKNKSSSMRLSATTRAKLLTDAGLLASAGDLTYDVAFDLSLTLSDENDVEPFYAFNEFFRGLRNKFQYTRIKYLLKEYVWQLFSPLYEQYGGFNEKELGDETTPQGIVMKVMCDYGAEDCTEALAAKFNRSSYRFEDCIVLQWGDHYIWEQTMAEILGHNKKNQTDLDRLKYFASCTWKKERIDKLLDAVALNQYSSSDEGVSVVISMIDDAYSLFSFMSNRWSEIKKKYEHKPDLLEKLVSNIVSKFYTSDGYDLVSDFYAARQHDMPSLLPVLRNAMQTIKEHAKWADRSVTQIESWIRRYLSEY